MRNLGTPVYIVLAVLVVLVIISTLTSNISSNIVGSVKRNLGVVYSQAPQCSNPWPSDVVVVDLLEIMKAPVALRQDDDKLIQHINANYMHPPSTWAYQLAGATSDPSMGQSKAIREILGDQRGGFFIECGALDGETRSNTLVFEKELGWKGLLVEGDPKNFELVKKKNRKAWSANVCLSTKPYPNKVFFKQSFNIGKISSTNTNGVAKPGTVEVQCIPVYSLMLALNVTTVDYFSLDVEGVELDVLRTIPWDKVQINTLSVEFIHGKEGKETLRSYMENKGYWVYKEVTHPGSLANDFIFVRKDFKTREEVERSRR